MAVCQRLDDIRLLVQGLLYAIGAVGIGVIFFAAAVTVRQMLKGD